MNYKLIIVNGWRNVNTSVPNLLLYSLYTEKKVIRAYFLESKKVLITDFPRKQSWVLVNWGNYIMCSQPHKNMWIKWDQKHSNTLSLCPLWYRWCNILTRKDKQYFCRVFTYLEDLLVLHLMWPLVDIFCSYRFAWSFLNSDCLGNKQYHTCLGNCGQIYE